MWNGKIKCIACGNEFKQVGSNRRCGCKVYVNKPKFKVQVV